MNKPRIPRGVRNNNPLNIRYVKGNNWHGRVEHKNDESFEEFKKMIWGYRAAFMLIHKYMNLYGLCTIIDIVARWAPTSDGNNTTSYANRVSRAVGIPICQKIVFGDWSTITKIVRAMAEVENGVDMSYVPVLEGYIQAAHDLGYYAEAAEAQEHINELIQMS